jgi:hypothetical protein
MLGFSFFGKTTCNTAAAPITVKHPTVFNHTKLSYFSETTVTPSS